MTEHTISTTDDGVAIGGYDPVAYFTEAQPVLGSPDHTRDWAGATWRFASEENAEQFAARPERFAPQFGGHCAFGATMGRSDEASPGAWRIIDDRLYLLRDNNVRRLSRLFTGRIRKASSSAR